MPKMPTVPRKSKMPRIKKNMPRMIKTSKEAKIPQNYKLQLELLSFLTRSLPIELARKRCWLA